MPIGTLSRRSTGLFAVACERCCAVSSTDPVMDDAPGLANGEDGLSGSNPDHKPINWVKAHYDSIHGRIATSWKLSSNHFELDVTIPANTTARVP